MSYPNDIHTIFTLVDNEDDVIVNHPNTLSAEIRALELKLGIDSSSDVTSIDYFLKHAAGAYRIHQHDGTSDDGSATLSPTTINAFALGGKLTAGANEIEGSNFDINGGTIDGITDLAIVDGGTGASTAQAALNALAGAVTANRVLRGNGANILLAQVDLTTDVTGILPVGNLPVGTTANKILQLNASAQLPAVDGSLLTGISTTPGAGTITSTMLKTATGAVSASGTGGTSLVLPGGSYGFYPQLKVDDFTGFATIQGLIGTTSTSYVTVIELKNSSASGTTYAQQRYVTASGEDLWIFLLIDKTTKEIISAYQAPDHPAYGNGGNFDKVPHPFGSYDETKQEIVLLDKETCFALKTESKQTGKSILTLINEEYKPKMDKEEVYQPLHSGKFIDDDTQVHTKVMVNTIPNYIKVRKLIKK